MNAVIYARYSSHNQTEQSIEGQLRDNYEWARQQGIAVIDEYIDRATTGTKDTRANFQRMIADAQKKQFQMIIVWKLDRFARNRYDSAIYKAKLKKYGVKVVSVKENITDSPEGIILEGLLESMAEYYSANLSQNVKRGQRENVAKGLFCGGHVLRGYRKTSDGKMEIDEKNAQAMRLVFEKTAENVPMKQISDELYNRGIRAKDGKPISVSCLARAIRNTAYIGNYCYNQVPVPGLFPPIVSDELFQKANRILDSRMRAPAAKKAKEDYLLQGKAFCGCCGAPMVGECGRGRRRTVYHYYACAAKKKQHTCHKKNERKDFIEQYVVEQTLQYVLSPSRAAQVAKAVVAEYQKEFSGSQIEQMEKQLRKLDRELDKLVDALIDTPKAARAKLSQRMEMVSAQKEDLEADLSRLRIAAEIQITEPEVLAWLKDISSGNPTDPDFCRRIIDTFINSVYLYDDKIIIFYNIQGSKQVTYPDLQSATPDGSDFNAYALPKESQTNPDAVIYITATGFVLVCPLNYS